MFFKPPAIFYLLKIKKSTNRPIIGSHRLSADTDCDTADNDYWQSSRLSANTDYWPIIGEPLVLDKSFGVTGLSWFYCYLFLQSFSVYIKLSQSSAISIDFRVAQGSVFGSLLFIFYTSEPPKIISSFVFKSKLYADESYIYSTLHWFFF